MLEIKTLTLKQLDQTPVSASALKLLQRLLDENPRLKGILKSSKDIKSVRKSVRDWVMQYMSEHPDALSYYNGETRGRTAMEKLAWSDFAAIRILDYLDNAGITIEDLNLGGKKAISEPFKMLWLAANQGMGGAQSSFFRDMIHLFRQFNGKSQRLLPCAEKLNEWMDRHHSGLEDDIILLRKKNKDRIINILTWKLDTGEIKSRKYSFPKELSWNDKVALVTQWWDDHMFHLRFAVRSPEMLNELLANSLDDETMKLLFKAKKRGIPFFINPYYLSLLNVNAPQFALNADLAIRYYVIYSRQLVEEFGNIVAWEREDVVEPGKPNAAGWILPTRYNVHRRYPEVAILIPDTMGRACAGLCASCQRMYDFQRGHLNFDLEKLKPKETWDMKLEHIMQYWENDSRLRDILITGGDALMSGDESLKKILEAVYQMALRKRQANLSRPEGEKYAEIQRVRLGTRLPAYLPQRITPALAGILSSFRQRASAAGIKQFVIQTHFQSPMEVTPEAQKGIERLQQAGWLVANQLVFTAPTSRRGHTAKLRKVLNDIGIVNYYTFSVKGYMENSAKFATNARTTQEQMEEKVLGLLPQHYHEQLSSIPSNASEAKSIINKIRLEAGIPFLATDRNVLNLPGVGKSMTYRVIGITRHGRRILQFDHDPNRSHSPIIKKLGKFIIAESKSVSAYIDQLEEMGEDKAEYESIWGYSIGETEQRAGIFEYPDFDFKFTDEITNIKY